MPDTEHDGATISLGPDLTDRHPATKQIVRYFAFGHLPEGPLRDTSAACHSLMASMVASLPDGPELTTGLRKLLEAKDCFVRQALDSPDVAGTPG